MAREGKLKQVTIETEHGIIRKHIYKSKDGYTLSMGLALKNQHKYFEQLTQTGHASIAAAEASFESIRSYLDNKIKAYKEGKKK